MLPTPPSHQEVIEEVPTMLADHRNEEVHVVDPSQALTINVEDHNRQDGGIMLQALREVTVIPHHESTALGVLLPEVESELTLCIEEEGKDILMHLPVGIGRSNITMRPGGLHLEIWYLILDSIDDFRSWVACGLTCKVLTSRIIQTMRDVSRRHWENVASLDLRELRRDLADQPVAGSLIYDVRVQAPSLTRLVFEFAGRLLALRHLRVQKSGWCDPDTLPLLRQSCFSAASRFRNLSYLTLTDVVFWSLGNLMRFACCFGSLRVLELENVSWTRSQGCCPADEPYAKNLRLALLKIINRHNVSSYRTFLASHTLLRNLTRLNIEESSVSFSAHCHIRISPTERDDTQNGAQYTVSARITSYPHASYKWLRALLNLLDGIFTFPTPPLFSRINLKFEIINGTSEDMFNFLSDEPLPLPLLRMQKATQVTLTKIYWKDKHLLRCEEELVPSSGAVQPVASEGAPHEVAAGQLKP
ncbi:hypothetical protein CERSUDRAFT_127621 [Gelatoporia subvermispora B]|uniref:Uncharacterized protein n=1 Tax=Ceriporiopsis subvermispora (strain B) TaxID=914234 RepID=M2P6X2_CERS8|nr:hypothetical protein CERSUDRAFT_127621 [Gelatoporia subvermispora B]